MLVSRNLTADMRLRFDGVAANPRLDDFVDEMHSTLQAPWDRLRSETRPVRRRLVTLERRRPGIVGGGP
jgi:hypothetical protein